MPANKCECGYAITLDLQNQILLAGQTAYACPQCGRVIKFVDDEVSNPITPKHYTEMAISPLEYITANDIEWCIGNVIKYVSRYKNKNGIEDLRKAQWYLNYQIKLEEEQIISEREAK